MTCFFYDDTKPDFFISNGVSIIEQARQNAYSAVNIELINCYWQAGEFISSGVSKAYWGDKTVQQQLAECIQNEYPDLKGYNRQ